MTEDLQTSLLLQKKYLNSKSHNYWLNDTDPKGAFTFIRVRVRVTVYGFQ